MDAFVAMRRFMVTNAEVFQRLSTMKYHQLEMQQHLQESDKRIDEVFRRLDEGNIMLNMHRLTLKHSACHMTVSFV